MTERPDQSEAPRPAHNGEAHTEVDTPRRRAFLELSFGERALAFWWSLTWQILFRWSPPLMNWWRLWLLRRYGAHIGRGCFIAPSTRIDFPWNLTLGDHVAIAHKCIINCMGTIHIGDRTHISQYAHLCAGTHDYHRRDMRILREDIEIGQDVWIAADAFVGPGVTIGDGALLAARSSAFRELPAGMICVGEPARPTKPREAKAAA